MNYLNNYYKINSKLQTIDENNQDYVENYLITYFNVNSLINLFKNEDIYNYFIDINIENDLYFKYKNLFKTVFRYDLKSSLSTGALKLEKIKNNNYKIIFIDNDNFHPKDIFQLNLWFYMNTFIKQEVINNFKNTNNYKLIKEKIEQNKLSNNDKFYFSEIDFFNWFERNIVLTFDILEGISYFIVPYEIELLLKNEIKIKKENIYDKEINEILYSNIFNFKSGDLILFLDKIKNNEIISITKI